MSDDLIERLRENLSFGIWEWVALLDRAERAVAEVERRGGIIDRLTAERDRLAAGGCARDQSTTQFCAEAVALAAKLARAEGLLIQSRDAVQDRYPALVARIDAYFAEQEPRT